MPFSSDNRKRMYTYTTPVFLKMNALHSVLIATIGICCIISFFNLHERPDPDTFLMVFFKEPFIMTLGLYTTWFISSFRTLPSRREEFRLLNSLPIANKKICDYFIVKDLLQYGWAPGFIIILNLGLLSVSPFSHLIRLSLLTLFIYIIIIIIKICLHIFIAIKRKGFEIYKYPIQNNPIIMALIITGFALTQLACIVNPALSSGTFFVISVMMSGAVCFSLLFLAQKLFDRWKNENLAFRIRTDGSEEMLSSGHTVSNFFQRFPDFNPLLIKNILKIVRGKNRISLLLTVIFILCAYLLSLNNERIEDSIAVLFGILCFYAFLFAYRTINQFTSDHEPPELIYLLPLKKKDIYVFHLLPLWGWFFIVAFLCTMLILVSGSPLSSAGIFLLKSMAAGFIFLQVAFNYTFSAYPDNKKAKKHFIYWCFTMVILSAIFYVSAIAVIVLMFIVSIFPLKKINFYKVS